jgi:hypothetical protein
VDESPKVSGFVSLKSVRHGASDAAAALAEIRQIYFKTTRKTIENDLAHAIDLLKSLASEQEREKATVYMEGLAQMRREWGAGDRRGAKRGPERTGKAEGTGSHGGTKKRRRAENKTK